MMPTPVSKKDEHEWQFALRDIGTFGLLWVVIKLLIRRGVIELEELREGVFTAAGTQ